MKIRERFNWLAQRPDRNYTLGEAYQYYVQGKELRVIQDNYLGLSRAGRFLDRAFTGVGVLTGASIIIPHLNSMSAIFMGVAMCSAFKAQALITAKMVDDVVRNRHDFFTGIIRDVREAKADRERLKHPNP